MILAEIRQELDPIDDEALIRRVVKMADAALKKEGNGGQYKEFDIDIKNGTLWYVSQGADDSKGVAQTIAHFFDSADIAPFTIKVISRDKWDGRFGQQKSAVADMTDDPELKAKIEQRDEKKGGWATVKVK